MVPGGPGQAPSGTTQETRRGPGLAQETLVSVVSLGLSRRGGDAAGDPPGRGSRRNRWAKVRGQSQRAPRMQGEEPPRFFRRTSGPAVLVLCRRTRRAAARCGPPGPPQLPQGPQLSRRPPRDRPHRALGPGATARPAATGVSPGRSSALPGNKSRRPRWSSLRAGRKGVRGAPQGAEAWKRAPPEDAPQTSQLSRAGGPGGGGACPAGTRVRGGGARLATGKLTAVV